jgi:hypothetical protein
MPLLSQGRFCNSCEKEIHDFSTWSDAELAKRLQSGEKLCGRISKDRLNRGLHYKQPKKSPIMALSVLTAMAASGSLMAQEKPQPSSPQEELRAQGFTALEHAEFANTSNLEEIVLTGYVTDAELGDSIPFVNIIVKQGEQVIAGATTDFQGKFSLQIKDYQPDDLIEIQYRFIGYRDTVVRKMPGELLKEMKLQPTAEVSGSLIRMEMKEESFIMGIMIPMESEYYNANGEARNWFGRNAYRLKRFFRK